MFCVSSEGVRWKNKGRRQASLAPGPNRTNERVTREISSEINEEVLTPEWSVGPNPFDFLFYSPLFVQSIPLRPNRLTKRPTRALPNSRNEANDFQPRQRTGLFECYHFIEFDARVRRAQIMRYGCFSILRCACCVISFSEGPSAYVTRSQSMSERPAAFNFLSISSAAMVA